MEVINISDYRKATISTTGIVRPAPIQIKDVEFIDNSPVKRKNAPDPIKDPEDIDRIIDYFYLNHQYRNLLLFIMGINLGLRCGELTQLKFGHIIDEDGNYKSEIKIREEKTKRKENLETGTKARQGNIRTCYINAAVINAMEIYISHLGSEIDLNSYLFTSESNNCNSEYYYEYSYKTENEPIQVKSVEKMLKKTINEKLGIEVNAGTHLMRKTFAYHVMMTSPAYYEIVSSPDRARSVEFLQAIFGHSSQTVTLHYIGITNEEIKNTCENLNLGLNATTKYLTKVKNRNTNYNYAAVMAN